MGMAWRNWFSRGNQKSKFSCVANLFAGQTSVRWKSLRGRCPPSLGEAPVDSARGGSQAAVLTADETELDGGRTGWGERKSFLVPS